MARLRSLTVKEREENENMKTAMHDLQDQLAKNKILIQEELKRTNEGEIAGKQMLASVTASFQLELRESSETNIQNTRKLEEERLAFSETNANITAELDSVRAEIEKLRLERLGLQDNIDSVNAKSEYSAKEMARLRSLTVKEREENENMKTAMHDLQDQLAKNKILIQEELKRTNEGEIAGKQMLASVTASFQLELRESRECYDANIRKSEEENLGKLESLRNEQQTVTDALRLEVLGLQDNIDSLNAKSEYDAKEMSRLQSLTVKKREENMKTAMHDLQDQLAKNKILIQEELKRTNEGEIAGKQMLASVTASFQLELRESSQTNIQNTRKLEEERLALRKSEEEKLGKLESLRNEQQTDALRLKVLGLQDNICVFREEKNSNADELAQIQSLTVKQYEENKNLKTEKEDYKDQLKDYKELILVNQELFTLDQTEKAENQQLLETEKLALRERIAVITKEFESQTEQTQAKNVQLGHDHQKREVLLNEQNESLKTALQDVQQQLVEAYQHIAWQQQVNEELSILTSEDQSDTSSIETTPTDQSDTSSIETTPEDQSDTSSIEITPEDQSDTSSIEITPEDQSDTSSIEITPEDQSDTSSIETTPTDHSIESLPESSLDEDETISVWRYGSKGLLSFALQVGISALVTVTVVSLPHQWMPSTQTVTAASQAMYAAC
ncbi:Cell surface glycoprotein 1 [Dissostichus eleginoides]|uniref:Cell surface glycoprotein 1 n=1 Tax=Dissostichus eleginoides TaxID=100907 RepID=A0AAD9C9Y7_DISEL|nr:Cell surface glycoprotein 1 [Dissostichus eleginoides]